MKQPNPIKVAWGVAGALLTTRRPAPSGDGVVEHGLLAEGLQTLAEFGLSGVAEKAQLLDEYISKLGTVDPDSLSRSEALAYWLNLYNAGAIRLAVEVFLAGEESVLRVPGGFSGPMVQVGGEDLSLDAIEHGKIRRFGDPRIHGALVCGSVSCPTIRSAPYSGGRLDEELHEQMSRFLALGGAVAQGEDGVTLSRVFLWLGADFVRPRRMPTFLPAKRKAVLVALQAWMPEALRGERRVSFQTYDWGLHCAVG